MPESKKITPKLILEVTPNMKSDFKVAEATTRILASFTRILYRESKTGIKAYQYLIKCVDKMTPEQINKLQQVADRFKQRIQRLP